MTPEERAARWQWLQQWRKELEAQPTIWYTADQDGNPLSFYESKEAALLEVRWWEARGKRGFDVRCEHIHSLKLSKERWAAGVEVPGDDG